MATYTNWEEIISFDTESDFKKAVSIMSKWINPAYLEDKTFWTKKELVFSEMFEVGDVGRGIHRGVVQLKDIQFQGRLIGDSSDGVLEGYIFSNDENKTVDLTEFGAKNNLPKPDCEEDTDEWVEWRDEVTDLWYDKNS